jgi:hypothetical protein
MDINHLKKQANYSVSVGEFWFKCQVKQGQMVLFRIFLMIMPNWYDVLQFLTPSQRVFGIFPDGLT